jgi:hypothetical protein
VYDPHSGGVKIPDHSKPGIKQRILACAKEHFAGKYTRIEVRFRGQFCYIDAYQEPVVAPGWPPADWGETQEEYIKRLRETPVHLCRLRYLGREDAWSWAFYTYSHDRYEPSVFDDGSWTGTPEDAFMLSANVYLQ